MNIDLGAVSIDPSEYAIQGNAILGIKETGKSYFATAMGERLMQAGVPIIALDPIGIWRFLRVAGKGAGFPVVVAGGEHGDLPLRPEATTEIVRAAMREGVSLVLDLYELGLSKSEWRRIVEAAVRTLLYENKGRGVRHIFIEEAAEFAPQRIGPDQGRVYSEIEKLARMGGNAQLGYTLINPRAAEVNKAVLELCDSLFLFRQKGKNAIEGLGKWLEAAGADGAKEVQRSLSTLKQGECWAWLGQADRPILVPRTPEKRTFHPDRRAAPQAITAAEQRTVNVSAFVETMKGSLEKIIEEAKANDPAELKKQIAELRRELQAARDERETAGGAGEPAVDEEALDRAHAEGLEKGRQEGFAEGIRHGQAEWAEYLPKMKERAGQIAHDATALGERLVEFTISGGNYTNPMLTPARAGQTVEVVPRQNLPPRRETVALPRRQSEPSGDLSGPQRKIIDGLAELESIGAREPKRILVANMAGYSHVNSTGFAKALSNLSATGLVAYPGSSTVALTPAGRAKATPAGKPLTTRELHERIAAVLDGPGRLILTAVLRHPRGLTRPDLARECNYGHVNSTGFAKALSRMHSLGFVDYQPGGMVTAAAILFPERRRS